MIEITEDQNVIVDGVLYEARQSIDGCEGCAFRVGEDCGQIYAPCYPRGRDDGKAVIFSKSGVQPKLAPVLTSAMTLRDHFAGQALNAAINFGWITADNVAEECYMIADAMMKAREK